MIIDFDKWKKENPIKDIDFSSEEEKKLINEIDKLLPNYKKLGFQSEDERKAYEYAIDIYIENNELQNEEIERLLSLKTKDELFRETKNKNLEFLVEKRIKMSEEEKFNEDLYRKSKQLEKFFSLNTSNNKDNHKNL